MALILNKNILYLILVFVIIVGCSTDYEPIEEPKTLFWVPSNFPQQKDQIDNPMTEQGIALGEKLFFDVRLSGNNTVSCASCHVPELFFSEGSALTTKGISGRPLLRHVPTLINLAWANNGLFWDGGSTNLESQAFAPLAHEDEMFQDLNALVSELQEDTDYVRLFLLAFNNHINANSIVKALAQYQRSLVFANSKYDKYIRSEGQTLSSQEHEGFQIYQNKCSQCHSSDLFTDNDYHNNGLEIDLMDTSDEEINLGRFRVTRDPNDLGRFKTPTLRNTEFTAPYMHDGRFATLEAVLDFYDAGMVDNGNVDASLKRADGSFGISLSAYEKESIIAFLKILTDK